MWTMNGQNKEAGSQERKHENKNGNKRGFISKRAFSRS